MFSSLDVSTSGLVAQRMRLDAISSNMANLTTTHNEAGEVHAYQPKFVVFQADEHVQAMDGAPGVKVASVETADIEPRWRYQPGHPDAMKEGERKGWVAYPNIDMTTETVDAMEATRAYEANVGVIEATKSMAAQALRILG